MSEQTSFDLPSAVRPDTSVLAIGLMSGTSQDGVDIALIDTDGESIAQFGPTASRPYTEPERTLLRRATAVAANLTDRAARPGLVAEAEQFINDAHGEAVEAFLAANALEASSIAAVGFHGQTLLHRPERRLTLQIGDGAVLAKRLGVPVVYDFRAADVAAGGQGAPLVPIYHRALVRRASLREPIAVLNIGGVANVTFIDGDDLIACDTGPGNALIDDFLRLRTGQPLDIDGRSAAAGRVDEATIARLLAHPFFALPPPKSLDRNDFRGFVGDALDDSSVEDGAATLTALTAAAVARVVPHLPRAPANWIVAGGGARNPTLMRMLAERIKPARIATAHELGWSIDSLEAQAFAYLAVRSLRGLPITFPGTTGVPRPLPGGIVARP
ncbi:MAG TPA: anhydro-N-acetylmuramic acid kinase [Xanthobacteraceae bacterium]|nr:anhydro-N-acetylmuramic acid kinase [Xanthobacteraceae bacterium]